MQSYYALEVVGQPDHVLVGRQIDPHGKVQMQWPALIGTPQDHILVEPVVNASKVWTTTLTLKSDPQTPTRKDVPEGESVIDALSDVILGQIPTFFDDIDDDLVDRIYADGFYENETFSASVDKVEYRMIGTTLSAESLTHDTALHVPLYTIEQIKEAQSKGFLDQFSACPLEVFLAKNIDNIKAHHLSTAYRPESLGEDKEQIDYYLENKGGVSPEQSMVLLVDELEKTMKRTPTSDEVTSLINDGSEAFRFHRRPAEMAENFVDFVQNQPLNRLAELASLHLRMHNTVAAYSSVNTAINDRVTSAENPTVTAIELISRLKYELGNDGVKGNGSYFDNLTERAAQNLAASKGVNVESLMVVAQDLSVDKFAKLAPECSNVFHKERELLSAMVNTLGFVAKQQDTPTMALMTLQVMSKLTNSEDARWIANRAFHFKSDAPEQLSNDNASPVNKPR